MNLARSSDRRDHANDDTSACGDGDCDSGCSSGGCGSGGCGHGDCGSSARRRLTPDGI